MKTIKRLVMTALFSLAVYGGLQFWPEISEMITNPPEQSVQSMKWNIWEKDNVRIQSLDYNQGEKLSGRIADLREKWSPDDESIPINLVVVNDKETLRNLFGHNNSTKEIRAGEIFIWFLWDDEHDLGI